MLVVRYSKNNTISHNNRKTGSYEHNENINKEKIKENITIIKFNSSKIEKDINEIYENDIIKYNNKQKRKDRKIKNYFKEKNIIKDQHELLIDISNNQNYFINENEADKKIWENLLKKFMKENNSSMYFTNVVIHLDEGRPHAHLNFIPKNNTKNRIQSWNSFKKMCTQINEEYKNNKKSAFENTIQKMLSNVYSIIEKENLLPTSYSKVDLKYTDVGSKKEKQIHLKIEDYKEKALKPMLVEKQILDEKVSNLSDTQQKLISSVNSLEEQETHHKQHLKIQEERMNQEMISKVEKNKVILEKNMNAELNSKRQEIEKSLNELKNEKKEWENEITEEMNNLYDNKQNLEEKIEKNQRVLDSQKNNLNNYEEKVTKLNDMSENLEKSIKSLKEEKQSLEKQNNEFLEQKEEEIKSLNELKNEKKERENEITEEMNNLYDNKQNLEEKIEKNQRVLDSQKNNLNNYEEKVTKLNDMSENLEKSIKSLKEEKQSLEKRNNEFLEQKEEEIKSLSTKKVDLEEKIEKLEEKHESLLEKVKSKIKKIFNNFKTDTSEEDKYLEMLGRDIDKLEDDGNWFYSGSSYKIFSSREFETNLVNELQQQERRCTGEEKWNLINFVIQEYNSVIEEKEKKLNDPFQKFKKFISLENIELVEEEILEEENKEILEEVLEEEILEENKVKKGRTM